MCLYIVGKMSYFVYGVHHVDGMINFVQPEIKFNFIPIKIIYRINKNINNNIDNRNYNKETSKVMRTVSYSTLDEQKKKKKKKNRKLTKGEKIRKKT